MNKYYLKSKTIWGIIVMILPVLLPLLGVSLGADDTALITDAGDKVMIAIGAVLATYGRIKATEDLSA